MDEIFLKRKEDAPYWITEVVIYDELITGLLNNGFMVPYLPLNSPGICLYPLELLIQYYLFPAKNGTHFSRLISFIKGHSPDLYKQIKYYESKEIEIDHISNNETKTA